FRSVPVVERRQVERLGFARRALAAQSARGAALVEPCPRRDAARFDPCRVAIFDELTAPAVHRAPELRRHPGRWRDGRTAEHVSDRADRLVPRDAAQVVASRLPGAQAAPARRVTVRTKQDRGPTAERATDVARLVRGADVDLGSRHLVISLAPERPTLPPTPTRPSNPPSCL